MFVDHFTKNKKKLQKLKKAGGSWYIYQNKLDKTCFSHDLVYGDFKNLPKRTAFDKLSRDKAYNIANISKYGEYQCGLISMVYTFSGKIISGDAVEKGNMSNQKLTENYTNPLFEKRKYTHFL